MDNRPVGFFDSGLGGLTALAAFKELLPAENIIYFGDTANCPYGVKTLDELNRLAENNLRFLASFGCKAVLAACGTVASNSMDVLNSFPLPVFNVLTTSTEKMASIPGDAPLAVLATDASIRAGAFKKGISALCGGKRDVLGVACQDFVELCENGHTDKNDPLLAAAVEKYLSPLKSVGVAAVLLGCTHFGIIEDAIRAFLGDGVQIVSASGCGAEALAGYIRANGLEGSGGSERYFTSGEPKAFDKMASVILQGEFRSRAEQARMADIGREE